MGLVGGEGRGEGLTGEKKKGKFWVRPLFRERNQHGQYHTLFAELRLKDRKYFFR